MKEIYEMKGAGLAALDGWFGAPLGGEAAHSLIYAFVMA